MNTREGQVAVDLALPPHLAELQAKVRGFAEGPMRAAAPAAEAREEYPQEFAREALRFARALDILDLRRMIAMPGTAVPWAADKHFATVLVVEELARGDVGLTMNLPGPQLGGSALMVVGTEAQKARWLKPFTGPEPAWGAMAMTEPGAGSDTASIRTTAVRDGDSWVLSGEKVFCTSGGLGLERSKGWVVVWAKVVNKGASGDAVKHAAMRPFLVPAGTPGVRVTKHERKMGIRASDTVAFVMEEARIPADHLLGAEGDDAGFKGAMQTFNVGRLNVAAIGLGIARAALDLLRELLGPVPAVHSLTAAQRELLRMEAELQAARLLTWRAAWLADRGLPMAAEASMAKVVAGRAAASIPQRCAALAGPLGVRARDRFERLVRDSKIVDIFEGTGQINTLIVARRILGYSREQLK
ncbi:MAG: acyl-CoA dehydrogenase family protein [Halobacteria archaeon]